MELTQLKYFAAIAECQHITKAAETLNISQPALSHSLRKLEQELGISLFDRTGRSVVLTPYGRSFYSNVRRIFLELDNAARERREMDTNMERLYLGTNCPEILSGVLLDFLEEQPQLRLRQTLLQSEDLSFLLSNGQIDAIVVEDSPNPSSFGECQKLGTIQLYAVLKADQWRITTDTIPFSAFNELPKILDVSNSTLSSRIVQLCINSGISQNHGVDVSSPIDGIRFAAMGYGAYITSGPVLHSALECYSDYYDANLENVDVLPITGEGCKWNLQMALSPLSQSNSVLQDLGAHIKSYMASSKFRPLTNYQSKLQCVCS